MDTQIAFLFVSLALSLLISRELLNSFINFAVELAIGLRLYAYSDFVDNSRQKAKELIEREKIPNVSVLEEAAKNLKYMAAAQDIAGKKALKTITCNSSIFAFFCTFPLITYLVNLQLNNKLQKTDEFSSVNGGLQYINWFDSIWYLSMAAILIYLGYLVWFLLERKSLGKEYYKSIPLNFSRYQLLIFFAITLFITGAIFKDHLTLKIVCSFFIIWFGTLLYRIPHYRRANKKRPKLEEINETTYHKNIKTELFLYGIIITLISLACAYLKPLLENTPIKSWVENNNMYVLGIILSFPWLWMICNFTNAVTFRALFRYLTHIQSESKVP